MKRYFTLCLKRTMRFFPLVLSISLVLFIGLTVILNAFVEYQKGSDDQKKFKIGVVGEDETGYLALGMTALQNFDGVRFAVELVELNEEQATKYLKGGEISAYIVIPDDFVQKAKRGEILSIKYVTTPGTVGLISMFKDELTSIISDLVEQSQRGVYGIDNALDENGHSDVSYTKMNQLNLKYIQFILGRTSMYEVESLGIGDGLSFSMYMFCGITVVFVLLTGIIYAPLFVKKDMSLNRVLYSKKMGAFKQTVSEYLAYLLAMVLLYLMVFSALAVLSQFTDLFSSGMLKGMQIIDFAIQMLPLVLMATALNFMIFELCTNLIAGVLLQFFTTLSLGYISGCLYPIYTFPDVIQRLSAFLPTAIARSYLADCVTGETAYLKIIYHMLFFAAFLMISVFVRSRAIQKRS